MSFFSWFIGPIIEQIGIPLLERFFDFGDGGQEQTRTSLVAPVKPETPDPSRYDIKPFDSSVDYKKQDPSGRSPVVGSQPSLRSEKLQASFYEALFRDAARKSKIV